MSKHLRFGTGVLFGVPNAGNMAANPTPYKWGVLQEASVQFKGSSKKLFGQNKYPVDVASSTEEVTGKAKLASFDVTMMNQFYFGNAAAIGAKLLADDEAGTVPATTTYVIQVSNHTTFDADRGVRDASTGAQLEKVATSPAAGQYSCDNTGSYTFASADANRKVLISYTYTSTTGKTISLKNDLQGTKPQFEMLLANNYEGEYFALKLNAVKLTDITIPTKQGDHWIMELNFEAFTDGADNLGEMYQA